MKFIKTKYAYNDSLAVVMETDDGKPYGVITMCHGGKLVPMGDSFAYFDTNNHQKLYEKLISEKMITPVGILGHSGCCTYPMVEFNEVLFEEHDE